MKNAGDEEFSLNAMELPGTSLECFLKGLGEGAVGQGKMCIRDRDEEVHYQRAYSLEKIKELIGKAGMELLAVYDAYTLEPPKEDSGRLTFVVREHGK